MCKISCSIISSDDVQDLIHIKQHSITSSTMTNFFLTITCSIRNSSVVVILVTPQKCLILLNTSSIGFRSGEYGSKYSIRTPKFKDFDSMVNLHVVKDEDTKWSRVGTTFR
jgi:hypothetical protein